MNSADYNLLTFKAISNFVFELAETFPEDHSLKLYDRLLKKTTLTHEVAIKKHGDAFKLFCVTNRDGIIGKNQKLFTDGKVKYSDKVNIDLQNLFETADNATSSVMWKHLLTISALVDPAGKAKEILKNNKESKEANFLSDILNKVESNVNPNTNPMEAVSSIMSSGVFTELITGMNEGIQTGNLDLGKLMNTVQDMCSSLGAGGSTSAGDNPMSILNSVMTQVNNGQAGEGSLDLSNLTSVLGPVLASATAPSKPTIEEI